MSGLCDTLLSDRVVHKVRQRGSAVETYYP